MAHIILEIDSDFAEMYKGEPILSFRVAGYPDLSLISYDINRVCEYIIENLVKNELTTTSLWYNHGLQGGLLYEKRSHFVSLFTLETDNPLDNRNVSRFAIDNNRPRIYPEELHLTFSFPFGEEITALQMSFQNRYYFPRRYFRILIKKLRFLCFVYGIPEIDSPPPQEKNHFYV